MFVSGVVNSVRTSAIAHEGGVVRSNVVELVAEMDIGPVFYHVNNVPFIPEVGEIISVQCTWVPVGPEDGYWSSNPYDIITFGDKFSENDDDVLANIFGADGGEAPF